MKPISRKGNKEMELFLFPLFFIIFFFYSGWQERRGRREGRGGKGSGMYDADQGKGIMRFFLLHFLFNLFNLR